jgi:hypothetical protein
MEDLQGKAINFVLLMIVFSSFNIASSFADIVVGDEVWLPGLTRKLPGQWPRWQKA